MIDTITPAELNTRLKRKLDMQLVDVRRKDDLATEPVLIPGAVWQDPADVDQWVEELSPDKEVIIYCARGGSVSRSTMATLRGKGFSVQYVEGGLAGWKEHGGEVEPVRK